jgi:hypothetical protein
MASKNSASGLTFEKGEVGRDAHFANFFTKSSDAKTRRITAVISSGEIDRDGEIIDPVGIEAAWPGFMKNPVLIAAHQHRLSDGKSPVIGKVLHGKRVGNEFIAEVQFSTTPLAEEYWTLYKDKTQRAFSIGFVGKKFEMRLVGGQRIKVWTQIELLELSAVAVPSNRDALSKSAARKQAFVAAKKLEAEADDYDSWDELCKDFGEAAVVDALGSREEANRKAQEWIDRIVCGDKNGYLPGEKGCKIEECAPLYNRFLDAYVDGMELVDDVQRIGNKPEDKGLDFVSLVKGKR